MPYSAADFPFDVVLSESSIESCPSIIRAARVARLGPRQFFRYPADFIFLIASFGLPRRCRIPAAFWLWGLNTSFFTFSTGPFPQRPLPRWLRWTPPPSPSSSGFVFFPRVFFGNANLMSISDLWYKPLLPFIIII